MNIQQIDIDKIELDYENPRIRHVLENRGPDDDDESREAALALALRAGSMSDTAGSSGQGTFDTLLESIKESGGITHPIIVNEANGKMKVIEGNTRAYIYKHFKEKQFPGEWDKIPCIVNNDLDNEKIEFIRLQSHLVGPRQWNPHSKGKYLHHLWKNLNMGIDKIIRICGGDASNIRDYIDAYEDMEEYYRPITDSFNIKLFSGFVELQRRSIEVALMDNNYTKNDFSEWLKDGRFSILSHIRKLPQILANDEAKTAFLNGNTNDAIPFLLTNSDGTDMSDASVLQLAEALNQKIEVLPLEEIRRMRADSSCTTRGALGALEVQLNDFNRQEFGE